MIPALRLLALALALACPGQAKASPHVVMFTMPPPGHCGPCERMKPIVHRMQDSGFPITLTAIRTRGVHRYPTFIGFVDHKEVARIVGVTTEKKLRGLIPSRASSHSPNV